mmetsp:Transcript_10509/g.11786  ORF Transcript_10509/g.11786 Transcript_10509/m.11786 type:complete len:178 (-) Transcript_10509:3-536(-)
MGIDFTFDDTAVIFSIIGAGFGASTATITIENILWSETSIVKRFLRGIIGSAIIVGIFLLTSLIPHEDHPTMFFFNHLLPHLLAAYCAYGLVPILSKHIGLVNKGTDLNDSAISIKSVRHISEIDEEESDNEEKKDTVEPMDQDLNPPKSTFRRFKSQGFKEEELKADDKEPLLKKE